MYIYAEYLYNRKGKAKSNANTKSCNACKYRLTAFTNFNSAEKHHLRKSCLCIFYTFLIFSPVSVFPVCLAFLCISALYTRHTLKYGRTA